MAIMTSINIQFDNSFVALK